jgi:hypothetical protein
MLDASGRITYIRETFTAYDNEGNFNTAQQATFEMLTEELDLPDGNSEAPVTLSVGINNVDADITGDGYWYFNFTPDEDMKANVKMMNLNNMDFNGSVRLGVYADEDCTTAIEGDELGRFAFTAGTTYYLRADFFGLYDWDTHGIFIEPVPAEERVVTSKESPLVLNFESQYGSTTPLPGATTGDVFYSTLTISREVMNYDRYDIVLGGRYGSKYVLLVEVYENPDYEGTPLERRFFGGCELNMEQTYYIKLTVVAVADAGMGVEFLAEWY